MDIQGCFHNIAEWTDTKVAALTRPDRSWVCQTTAYVLPIVVVETLCLVGVVYHSIVLCGKSVPFVAKQILWYTPITTLQELGKKIPDWATWNQLRNEHLHSILFLTKFAFRVPTFAWREHGLPPLMSIFPKDYGALLKDTGKDLAKTYLALAVTTVVVLQLLVFWKEGVWIWNASDVGTLQNKPQGKGEDTRPTPSPSTLPSVFKDCEVKNGILWCQTGRRWAATRE